MVSVLTSRKKKAILKWKAENPDKYFLDMKSNEVIKLNDCDYVNIGRMMSIFRSVYHAM